MSLVRKMRGLTLSALFAVTISVSIVGLVYPSHNRQISTEVPREYKTKTGRTIIVSETHPVGRSLSTIEISTKGFEDDDAQTYEHRDPISGVFLADLGGNGFDEICIITTSAGTGSYGTVLGFASNKDKSLSMIHFPAIKENQEYLEGHMGHDAFKMEDRKFVRVFPIY